MPEIEGLPTLGDLVTVAAATDSAEVSSSAAPAPVSTPAAVEALPFLTTVAEAPAPPPPPPPPPTVLPQSPLLAPFTTEARGASSTPEPVATVQPPAASAAASVVAPPPLSPSPAMVVPLEPMGRLVQQLPAADAFSAPLLGSTLEPAQAMAPIEWLTAPEDLTEPEQLEPVTEAFTPAPVTSESVAEPEPEPVESSTEQVVAAEAQPAIPATMPEDIAEAEPALEPEPEPEPVESTMPAPFEPASAAEQIAAAVAQPERSHQAPPFAPAPPRSFRSSVDRRSAAPAQPPVVIAPWPN